MEYGKFATAEELLKGYNELEKSFTQKCQQLALLQREAQPATAGATDSVDQSGTNAEASPLTDEMPSTTVEAETVPCDNTDVGVATDGTAVSSNPTEEQLQQYLQRNPDVLRKLLQQSAPQVPVMSGGGNVSLALPSKPKTIKEASIMAKELFKN